MFQFLHKQEMKMLKSGITGLSAWGLNSNLRRVPTKPPSLPSFLGSCSSPVLAPYLAFPVLAHPHKSLFSTGFSHFYFSEHPVCYKCNTGWPTRVFSETPSIKIRDGGGNTKYRIELKCAKKCLKKITKWAKKGTNQLRQALLRVAYPYLEECNNEQKQKPCGGGRIWHIKKIKRVTKFQSLVTIRRINKK